ncbi:hypothetical protein D6851_10330 [Altericroceibacterium spongiae]|uniref:Uncharacterized protein n=1 Tax=Altericroceibacterium spongiae TaxID=2320269 RepID=A0A420EIK8_9SPHN|nr:hypothetical protein D6851_10330 [Altericroceibacterium spongiae]
MSHIEVSFVSDSAHFVLTKPARTLTKSKVRCGCQRHTAPDQSYISILGEKLERVAGIEPA